MDYYRIVFYTVGKTNEHIATNAIKANHYHVLCTNKGTKTIGEHNKLQAAIEKIIEYEGEHKDLTDLIDNIYFLQNTDSRYICTGITYSEKHGIKLEMIIDTGDSETLFS